MKKSYKLGPRNGGIPQGFVTLEEKKNAEIVEHVFEEQSEEQTLPETLLQVQEETSNNTANKPQQEKEELEDSKPKISKSRADAVLTRVPSSKTSNVTKRKSQNQ